MVLIVHHLGHSQSDRIVFLCEELEIPYELKKYDRGPLWAPPEYKALHPTGAAPVIEDGNVKIAESGACLEYILNVYGKGRLVIKPGEPNYGEYLYWLHFTNGTLQPFVGRTMILNSVQVSKEHPIASAMFKKLDSFLQMLDERVSKNTWLAGEQFTAADIMIIFTLTTMREFAQTDLSAYPHVLAYTKRVVERPGYQRALQKGDPDLDIQQFIKGPPPPLHPALRPRM